MWRKCIRGVGLGLAVTLAFPATAATSASARVTGLTFELIDLDLNDGVAAGVTWNSMSSLAQVDNRYGQSFQLYPQADGSLLWGVTFGQSASEFASADASFSSSASFAAGATAVSSETGSLAQVSTTAGGQELISFAYMMGDFVLSANTELRVTGFAESSISGSGSANADVPDGVDAQIGVAYSQASTFLEVALGDQSFNQSLAGLNYAPNNNHSVFSVADYAGAASSSFSLAWRNSSGEDQAGYFSLLAQSSVNQIADVSGGPIAAPVPEPETWLLMTLGLSAMGLSLRRKRQAD